MAGIDPSIALQSQAPQDNRLNMLAQFLQFQQALQRNKLLEMQMQNQSARQPYEIQKLQAEADAIPALADTRRAQQLKAQLDAAQSMNQMQGRNELLNLLRTGGSTESNPTSVMMDENAARNSLIDAEKRGQQVNIAVPNPATLRAAAIQANPKEGIDSLLKSLNPASQRPTVIGPGASGFMPGQTTPFFTSPFAPRQDQQVVIVQTPEGPKYVPRPEAGGQTPAVAPPAEKSPVGYRRSPAGDLEAIPGGPADLKITGQFNADTSAMTSSQSKLDDLAKTANMILNHPGLKGITGLRGAIPNIPGTDAADAQAQLNTLKSQVSFGVLQDMRNNSKTGGALGNVSDAEGKRLEANLAALEKSQSVEQMQDSLRRIIKFTDEAKDRLRGAYNMKYQGRQNSGSERRTPAGAGTRNIIDQADAIIGR